MEATIARKKRTNAMHEYLHLWLAREIVVESGTAEPEVLCILAFDANA